jgi:hypothetical protein
MDEKVGPESHIEAKPEKLKRRHGGKPFEPGNPYRFKPGKEGGRPEGAEGRTTKLSRAYAEWLEAMVASGEMTNAEALAWRMGNIALTAKAGQAIAAAKEITDRVEGRPLQAIAIRQEIDEATAKRLLDLALLLKPKDVPLLEAEIIEEGESTERDSS